MCISAADTGQYWLTLGCGGRAEIINELARNHDLLLIGRDSSFALANQKLVARFVATLLNYRRRNSDGHIGCPLLRRAC
jgi:TolB-like protein